MPEISTSPSGGNRVGIADVVIVLLLAMAWFFLVQVSSSFVVVAMSGVAFFLVSMYFLSKFTGVLGYMKLTIPTWTISYIISLPIWLLVFAVLPTDKLPSAVSSSAQLLLEKIFSPRVLDWMVNSLFFAITESLLVVFLFAFFIGITIKNTQRLQRNKRGQLAAIFFIASFVSLLHTGIAIASAVSGGYTLTTILIHQLVAFFLMMILGSFLGAPGIVAPHMSKNDLVYADVGLWWVSLLICILIDLYSLVSNRKSGEKSLMNQIKSNWS